MLLTGKDKILRKYKIPEDNITKLNLTQKVATNPPTEELDGHPLKSNLPEVNY